MHFSGDDWVGVGATALAVQGDLLLADFECDLTEQAVAASPPSRAITQLDGSRLLCWPCVVPHTWCSSWMPCIATVVVFMYFH